MSQNIQPLTARVRDGLLAMIESEKLQPGARLPSTEALCDRFAASRTVVREAIANLTAQGLLQSRRGSGVYLSALPDRTLPVHFASPQNVEQALDLLELRLGIEIEAAGLAAERRTAAGLSRLDAALETLQHTDGGVGASAAADRAYHLTIAALTGNRQYELLLTRLGDDLIPRRSLGVSFTTDAARDEFAREISAEHQALHNAIAREDAEAARRAMRRHLDNATRRYRDWSQRGSR